jgi:protein-tyrosine phosphatase
LIDLHTHLLPGVDDGVQDEAEALETVRRAVVVGVSRIVATPHVISGVFANDRRSILNRVIRLQEVLDQEGIPMQVSPGAEYYAEPELPQKLDRGELLTLNDRGRHLLVELSAQELPAYAEQVFFELLVRGVTPVLAHPERNQELVVDPGKLHRLVQRGVLVQVTAGSLVGLFGREVRAAAELFVSRRWVHFIASDLHGPGQRLAALPKAVSRLNDLLGGARAQAVVFENPRRVLDGRPVAAGEPHPGPPLRTGVRKLWRLFGLTTQL